MGIRHKIAILAIDQNLIVVGLIPIYHAITILLAPRHLECNIGGSARTLIPRASIGVERHVASKHIMLGCFLRQRVRNLIRRYEIISLWIIKACTTQVALVRSIVERGLQRHITLVVLKHWIILCHLNAVAIFNLDRLRHLHGNSHLRRHSRKFDICSGTAILALLHSAKASHNKGLALDIILPCGHVENKLTQSLHGCSLTLCLECGISRDICYNVDIAQRA